jgi:predicted dehydrogenase
VPKAIESVLSKTKQTRTPKGVSDFRRILDDKEIDALVIATPDHWHAPAAILGCAAGKHVYVVKPCCHNPQEGELLVAAARKHKRLVQHGTQKRSWPAVVEGIEKLREGEIGRILFAKCWYYGPRETIGKGKAVPVPKWLDYNLWQGPAPETPYQDNVVHYNWHWFWHWGTGELGNNGVHSIDLCRWGLGVDYPLRVTSSGGKYRFPEDDQETPDTNVVSFDFGETTISWEQRSWVQQTPLDPPHDIAFYGERGVLTIRGGAYTISDFKGKALAQGSGNGGNQTHLENFAKAIRGDAQLHAEIEEGFKSTLLCHLGNIAYRTGRTVHFDPKERQIAHDGTVEKLWSRAYRKGWEPKV